MPKLLHLLSLLCLGCSAPPDAAAPARQVDPAPIEAVRPTGPHAVGVAEGPALGGGVRSRVYYPAAAGGRPAAPEPVTAEHRAELARRFGPAAVEALAAAEPAARRNAPRADGAFPLVVFQPGASLGGGDYRLLIEGLASRGYVVLVLNPDGSPRASAGRYPVAADELVEAVALARAGHASLTGADTTRVALLGHSIGGAAAVMALDRVPGALAINLDGDYAVATRIPEPSPVLYLIGRSDGEGQGSRARRAAAWRDASAGAADAVVLQVDGLKHFDFADAALIQSAVPEAQRRERFGVIGGRAAHDLTVELVAAFLDSRLKGDAAAWPAAVARSPQAAPPGAW